MAGLDAPHRRLLREAAQAGGDDLAHRLARPRAAGTGCARRCAPSGSPVPPAAAARARHPAPPRPQAPGSASCRSRRPPCSAASDRLAARSAPPRAPSCPHAASAWSRRQCPSARTRMSRASSASATTVRPASGCSGGSAARNGSANSARLARSGPSTSVASSDGIQVMRAQPVQQGRGLVLPRLDLQRRQRLAQWREHQRQQVGRQRRDDAEPEPPGQRVAQVARTARWPPPPPRRRGHGRSAARRRRSAPPPCWYARTARCPAAPRACGSARTGLAG